MTMMKPTKTNRRKLTREVKGHMDDYLARMKPDLEKHLADQNYNVAAVRLMALLEARRTLDKLIMLEQQS